MNDSPIGRDHSTQSVEGERTGPGKHRLAARPSDEEPIALNGDVRRVPGELRRTLTERGDDATDLHAEADLRRIRTTEPARAGRWYSRPGEDLTEHVLEHHGA